ncbi:hypothetical protein [Methanosphaera sp.]|uniref:hypothetical protein n=1 Tax=Methanosphaera sp. TaxID=2666342 RepID=UPI0025CF22D9|nr:hypothetical protein [Methanosphaera sp.]
MRQTTSEPMPKLNIIVSGHLLDKRIKLNNESLYDSTVKKISNIQNRIMIISDFLLNHIPAGKINNRFMENIYLLLL